MWRAKIGKKLGDQRRDGRRQRGAQVLKPGQRFAQAGQVARPGIAQGNAAGDAFDVSNAAQAAAGFTSNAAIVVEQEFDGAMARGRNIALAQRVVQRMTQQAGAHARHAVVEQRKQRRRRLAAQRFGQFKIAPRGEVEAEVGTLDFHGQPT